MRIEEKRDDLVMLCRNIYAKRDDIMAVEIQKDYLELQGFTYNESTFDDLFLKRGFQQHQVESSDSSDDEAEEQKEESKASQWGADHASIMKGPSNEDV